MKFFLLAVALPLALVSPVAAMPTATVPTKTEWPSVNLPAEPETILLVILTPASAEGSSSEAEARSGLLDAFGKPTVKDKNFVTLTTSKIPFLFTGRQYDWETGLYHYRARDYQPELGRFLQPDPIDFVAGDVNIYRYCGNDPINWNDPFGLIERMETDTPGAAAYLKAEHWYEVPVVALVNTVSLVNNTLYALLPPLMEVAAAMPQSGAEVQLAAEALAALKVVKTAKMCKISRAAQIAEKGHTQQATEALTQQAKFKHIGRGEAMRSIKRSLQEEKAAWKRGEYE